MCHPSLQMAVPVPSDSPDSFDAETVKAGFHFGADPVQWRACSGEWRGPAYSEASLKDFDQSAFEGTGEHTGRGPLLVQVQGADRE